jgi:hypothetical protein
MPCQPWGDFNRSASPTNIVITPTMSSTAPVTVSPTETRILPVVTMPVSTAQPSHTGQIVATDTQLTDPPAGRFW